MSPRDPLFAGLVYNEEGEPVQATQVGQVPYYAIPDGGFLRHVEAIEVDREVLRRVKERLLGMKDVVVEGVMQIMGSDDPFTRAAIEMSLENLDRILELPEEAANLDDLRIWLWMTGFRIVVNVHGEVLRVEMKGLEEG